MSFPKIRFDQHLYPVAKCACGEHLLMGGLGVLGAGTTWENGHSDRTDLPIGETETDSYGCRSACQEK